MVQNKNEREKKSSYFGLSEDSYITVADEPPVGFIQAGL